MISCFSLSNYLSFVFICFSIPILRLKLFFFFTVLFYFLIERLLSSRILSVLLLYSNCSFCISLISIKVSQSSFIVFLLFSSSFISLTNNAEIELSSSFSKGDYYLCRLNLLLLNVCIFLVLDLWLWVFMGSCSKFFVCCGGGDTSNLFCHSILYGEDWYLFKFVVVIF